MLNKVLLVVALSAVLSETAGAFPVEFEFRGVFTDERGTVHEVGESFVSTVLFESGSADSDPSPQIGRYRYVSWTVPSETAQPYVFASNPPGRINIINFDDTPDLWKVDFIGANAFNYQMSFEFPMDTFATDALPLSLPLSQAIRRELGGGDGNFLLVGTVNSLTVRAVPEPAAACLTGALLVHVMMQRKRIGI